MALPLLLPSAWGLGQWLAVTALAGGVATTVYDANQRAKTGSGILEPLLGRAFDAFKPGESSNSANFSGAPDLAKPNDGIVSIDKNGRFLIQRGSSQFVVPKEIAQKISILNSDGKPSGSFKEAFLQLADGTMVIAGYDENQVPVIELQKGINTIQLPADSKLDLELMTLTKDYGISSIQVAELDDDVQVFFKESLQILIRPEAKDFLNKLGFENVESLQRFCSSAGRAELEKKLEDFQQIFGMQARAIERWKAKKAISTKTSTRRGFKHPFPPEENPLIMLLIVLAGGTVISGTTILGINAWKSRRPSEVTKKEEREMQLKAKAEREKEIAKPASDERTKRVNFVQYVRIPTMRYIEALRQNKLINTETTESSATNKRLQKNPADKAKFDERQQKLRDESDRFLEEAKMYLKENLKKEDPKKRKVAWKDEAVEDYIAFLNNKNVASPEGIPPEIINGIEKVLLAGKSVNELERMEKDLSAGLPVFAYAEVDKFKQAYPHNFSLYKSELSRYSDADLKIIIDSVKALSGKKNQKAEVEIKLEQIQTWILVASGYHHVISSVESEKDFPAAVEKFQGEHNLKPDGIVGDKTMEMLIKVKNYITSS